LETKTLMKMIYLYQSGWNKMELQNLTI
jgi:hypothetical protein